MVNVNGGRDWSAATKDCPEFLGSLTQVKYFSTNLITVRAHRGHTWSEATQNPFKFYKLSVNPETRFYLFPKNWVATLHSRLRWPLTIIRVGHNTFHWH